MNRYHYYQQNGGDEVWKPIPADMLGKVAEAMFVTILSVSPAIADEFTKEDYAAVKYKGPLYFDLDDEISPYNCAKDAIELLAKLAEMDVPSEMVEIYATGSKGFHLLVPEECFVAKPEKIGTQNLPLLYREMAWKLQVRSMDMRVYSARKGRMLRQVNVERPNGKFKVKIDLSELHLLADMERAEADEKYSELCGQPRSSLHAHTQDPELCAGLAHLYDSSLGMIKRKLQNRPKKAITIPKETPSLEMALDGVGIKDSAGFHALALQLSIAAHGKGWSRDQFVNMADGLIEVHQSDSSRYNTAPKRRQELGRMWDYTEDNPCYDYSPGAIKSLLSHTAPDLNGIPVAKADLMEQVAQAEEAGEQEDGEESDDDAYDHAGVVMTNRGVFAIDQDGGSKQLTAMALANATELVSVDTNQVTMMEAEILVGGRNMGRHAVPVDTFNVSGSLNKFAMRHGQTFVGSDNQSRGVYLRMVEQVRRKHDRVYAITREGLDMLSIPFSSEERLTQPFLLWADGTQVLVEPAVADLGAQFRFSHPYDPHGLYKTDVSQADNLKDWADDPERKEKLAQFFEAALGCQHPKHIGKLVGWQIAAFFRMMFHRLYDQFPILHVNGPAGSGKTSLVKFFTGLHYYRQEPKVLTPNSSLFAVSYAASASASIPLVLDEFKPQDMKLDSYNTLKLMMRDAYNCRVFEKGGGNASSTDYRAIDANRLSAPIAFIAEAVESESALMERAILVTVVKPDVVKTQKYLHKYLKARDDRHLLGILGKYVAAEIVMGYSLERLKDEFTPIYDAARRDLTLQEGETVSSLGEEKYRQKASSKERTVFNYAVVQFGLQKLRGILRDVFDDRFDELMAEMLETAYSSVDELQGQTIPEWLKVFHDFPDMAELDPESNCYLKKNVDYAIVENGGRRCFALYAKGAYIKYRKFKMQAGLPPLFPSEQAFKHALPNIAAFKEIDKASSFCPPGGAYIFDLEMLRQEGFTAPGDSQK